MSDSNRTEIFDRIYAEGGWSGRGSGGGSDPDGARPYVDFVMQYIGQHGLQTVVDVGCGDWRMWPTGAFANGPRYVGIDASAIVVEQNRRALASDSRRFIQLDAVQEDLPAGDLLLCKEVVQHLGNADVLTMLQKAVDNFAHVIVCADTSMVSTSPWRRRLRASLPSRFSSAVPLNTDIQAGGYRLVDLRSQPFNRLPFSRVLAYTHMTGGRCLTTKTIWVKHPSPDTTPEIVRKLGHQAKNE